ADPAPGVPAHGDWRRGRPARSRGRGARLGERRRLVVRLPVEHDALDPGRWRERRARLPPLGEQRPDDLLLLRRRAGGATGVRPRGAAGAAEVALPMLASIGGMTVAVAIFLAFDAGRSSAHGWGVAMSTDTAFALGLLALVGPRFPDRLRAFMVTVAVVDDVVALLVIATVYTETLRVSLP